MRIGWKWKGGYVMNRLAIVSAIIMLVSLPGMGESSSPWVWGPLLGAVGDDSIAICWETSRSVGIDLHYALARIYDATKTWQETLTFDKHEGHGEVWLRDLAPGEVYRYQLVAFEGDAVYPSRIGTFRTSSGDLRSFSFITYGETRSFPDRHKLVATTIAQDEPDASFVVHVGGIVESPTPDRLHNFFWAIDELGRSHPYLPVVDDRSATADLYYESFALPPGGGRSDEEWWSFNYGNAHLIGLDSSVVDREDEERSDEQLAWLRQDLSQAAGKLIVVFTSSPLYSSIYPTGKNEALCSLFEPLFVSSGVKAVVSGGISGYEHIYVNGIHYLTTGGGGAPPSEPINPPPPGEVFRRVGLLHYVRITIADYAMRLQAIPVGFLDDGTVRLSSTGNAIDAFTVTASD